MPILFRFRLRSSETTAAKAQTLGLHRLSREAEAVSSRLSHLSHSFLWFSGSFVQFWVSKLRFFHVFPTLKTRHPQKLDKKKRVLLQTPCVLSDGLEFSHVQLGSIGFLQQHGHQNASRTSAAMLFVPPC